MPARRPRRSASARISDRATTSPAPIAATATASPRAATSTGMMQELFAKEGGLCGGKGGSMHIADLDRGMLGANGIVGGGPPLVVGAALTAKTLGTRHRRGVVHRRWRLQPGHHLRGDEHGGGAEAAGDLRVREQPLRRRHRASATRSAATTSPAAPPASACRRVKVNGDDFFAVHEAAREAVERARSGGGPSAIEVDTCRFYGHHSGDAQLYRGKDEVQAAARGARLPEAFPPPRRRGGVCWRRRSSTRSMPRSRR